MKTLRKIFVGISVAVTVASFRAATSLAQVGGIQNGIQAARGTDQPADLFGDGAIFTTFVNLLLFVVGAIAVIMIIIGGLRYVISGEDASNVTAAKNTILYAIVGVIVALLAYAAINFVVNYFTLSGGMSGL